MHHKAGMSDGMTFRGGTFTNVSRISPFFDHVTELLFVSMCWNYSFEIFAYRIAKRKSCLLEIRRYIELDKHHEKHFTPQERSELMEFFGHVDKIIECADAAQATKNLDTDFIRALINAYSYWKMQNLLPKNPLAEDRPTLLNKVDAWIDGSAWSKSHMIIDFTLKSFI